MNRGFDTRVLVGILTVAGMLIALTGGVTAGIGDWDGARINYTYTDSNGNKVDNVEILVYDCEDDSCSTKSSFSGNLPFGTTTSTGEIAVDYPADIIHSEWEHSYAAFHFADGYQPEEYLIDTSCQDSPQDYDWCGPIEKNKVFEQKDVCSSTIDSFTVENDVYVAEPVVVDVSSSMSSDVKSALRNADTGVNFLPPKKYREQYYSTKTKVIMEVKDKSGNVLQSKSKTVNIYMDDTESVNFGWTPSSSGKHNITVKTKVTDPQCADTEVKASWQKIDVQEERPKNEYYTLLNDLDLQRSSKIAGNQITFSFDKISNYADFDSTRSDEYKKHPVETQVNYDIKKSGSSVKSDSLTLGKNSNPTDYTTHSFSWNPQNEGDYVVSVTGESVKEAQYSGTNTIPKTVSTSFTVKPRPEWTIDFQITDSKGDLKDAKIKLNGKTKKTDVNGEVSFSGLKKGDYTYEVSKTGFETITKSLSISSATADPLTISEKLDYTNTAPSLDLPDSERQIVQGTTNTNLDLDDYIDDKESKDSQISWSYTKSGLSGVTVGIKSDRTLEMAASGSYTDKGTITFTATDPAGETVTDTLTVKVTKSNKRPSVSLSDVSLNEDEVLNDYIDLESGSKVSDDETSFSNLNLGLTVDDDRCGVSLKDDQRIDIAPKSNFNGQCTATVTATDQGGLTGSDSFDINVNSVNDAPSITSQPTPTGPVSITDTETHSYTVKVSDPDHGLSSMSFSKLQGPGTLAVSSNGVVEWKPSKGTSGTFDVKLEVKDSAGATDTQSYSIDVTDTSNSAPQISSITADKNSGLAPLEVSFSASASDPDGTINSYSWSFGDGGKKKGSSVDYTYEKKGKFTARVTVKDDSGAEAIKTITIDVDGNKLPSYTSNPVEKVYAGEEYVYDVDARDPEGKKIQFSLVNAPKGMKISKSGKITWETDAKDAGAKYNVKVKASDGKKSRTQSFNVEVQSKTSTGANIYIDGSKSQDKYDIKHNKTVEIEAVTGTEKAPVEVTSNFTGSGWKGPLSRTGNYTNKLTLEDSGYFRFNVTAGKGDAEFSISESFMKVNVTPTETSAEIFIEEEATGNKITKFEKGEEVKLKASTGTENKFAQAPFNITSKMPQNVLKNGKWNNITRSEGTGGSYEKSLTFDIEGTYSIELTAGKGMFNNKDYLNSTDPITFEVTAPGNNNGGGSNNDDNSDDDSSGGGGGGGGGGGSFSLSTTDTTTDVSLTNEETVEKVETESMDLESNEKGQFSGELDVSVGQNETVELELTGLEGIGTLTKSEYNVTGNTTISVNIQQLKDAKPGNYTGTLKVTIGSKERDVEVSFSVPKEISNVGLNLEAEDVYYSDKGVNYTVNIDSKNTTGQAEMYTVVQESNNVRVFNKTVSLNTRSLEENLDLEPGKYTVSITLNYKGSQVTDSTSFEVRRGRPRTPTGGFFGSSPLSSLGIENMVEGVRKFISKISPF